MASRAPRLTVHNYNASLYDHLSAAPTAVAESLVFGLLNPEHLRAISVCEVSEHALYRRNQPAPNGPNDPRLGASHSSALCATCGQGIVTCENHWGYVTLRAPCYQQTLLKDMVKLARVFCLHCSRLLPARGSAKFRKVAALRNASERLSKLAEMGVKTRVCGGARRPEAASTEELVRALEQQQQQPQQENQDGAEAAEEACGCGGEQYDYWEDGIRIWYGPKAAPARAKNRASVLAAAAVTAERTAQLHAATGRAHAAPPQEESKEEAPEPVAAAADSAGATGATGDDAWQPLSAKRLRQMFCHISDEDVRLVGLDPQRSRPEWMIWTLFPVLPPKCRPQLTAPQGGKAQSEDDLTKKIRDVVRANNTLDKLIQTHLEQLVARAATHASARQQAPKRAKKEKHGDADAEDSHALSQTVYRFALQGLEHGRTRIVVQSADTEQKGQEAQEEGEEEDDEEEEEEQKRKQGGEDEGAALRRHVSAQVRDLVDWSAHEATREAARHLQEYVALWFRSDLPVKLPGQRSYVNSKTIEDRYKGKYGRVRLTMIGKRVDFSGRGVITPAPELGVDELGVPRCVAVHLTTPETVNAFNLMHLTKAVRNGPHVWPGARSVIKPGGEVLDLRYCNRYELVLELGWVVERHLKDGDTAVFNRQPSLHRPSIMCHRLRVVDGYTFRLNLSVCKPYNADYDGDQMTLHVLQWLRAIMESESLMYVNNQILSPQNCKPIIAQVQDPVVGVWLMTWKDTYFTAEEFMRYLGQCADTLDPALLRLPRPAVWTRCRVSGAWRAFWSGKQLFSALLPPELYMSRVPGQFEPRSRELLRLPPPLGALKQAMRECRERMAAVRKARPGAAAMDTDESEQGAGQDQRQDEGQGQDEGGELAALGERLAELKRQEGAVQESRLRQWLRDELVVIADSQLLHGRIGAALSGATSGGLTHRIVHKYSADLAAAFMTRVQKVANALLVNLGLSVGISDCVSPCDAQVQRLLDRAIPDIQNHPLLQKSPADSERVAAAKEQVICTLLQELRKTAGGMVQAALNDERHVHHLNRLMHMVLSESKGNVLNLAQILGHLGQVIVEGKRPVNALRGRGLPHVEKFSNDLGAAGHVRRNLARGLDPMETYHHSLGGREGLVNTAITTSETGYTNRKLIKAMESTCVRQDGTVRDSGNNVVDMMYGGDGFDASWLCKAHLHSLLMDDAELRAAYDGARWLGAAHARHWPAQSDVAQLLLKLLPPLSDQPQPQRPTSSPARRARPQTPGESKELQTERLALKMEFERIQHDRDTLRQQQLVHPGDQCQTEVMVPADVGALIEEHAMKQHKRLQALPCVQGAPLATTRYLRPSELVVVVNAFIDSLYRHFPGYHHRNLRLEALLRVHLCARNLLVRYQLDRESVAKVLFALERCFVNALVAPGEMAGVIAAQSQGEFLTQGTMKVFHLAGTGNTLNDQLNSLQSYINMAQTVCNPSMTIYLNELADWLVAGTPEFESEAGEEERALRVADFLQRRLVETRLRDLVQQRQGVLEQQVLYEPAPPSENQKVKEKEEGQGQAAHDDDSAWLRPLLEMVDAQEWTHLSPYVVRYVLDLRKLRFAQIPWTRVLKRLEEFCADPKMGARAPFLLLHSPLGASSSSSSRLVLRLYVSRHTRLYNQFNVNKDIANDEFKLLERLAAHLCDQVLVSGIRDVASSNLVTQTQQFVDAATGALASRKEWCIVTKGSNLAAVLGLPWVDARRTTTNDIREICDVFGIHAAGNALKRGILLSYARNDSSVEQRHIDLLVRTMVHRGYIMPLRRQGMNKIGDAGALSRASFEETSDMLREAARRGERDALTGTTENIMIANVAPAGTGISDVRLDAVAVPEALARENRRRLEDAVLPDVTPMDLAVLVYATGQEHAENYTRAQREAEQRLMDAPQREQQALQDCGEALPQRYQGSEIDLLRLNCTRAHAPRPPPPRALCPLAAKSGDALQGAIRDDDAFFAQLEGADRAPPALRRKTARGAPQPHEALAFRLETEGEGPQPRAKRQRRAAPVESADDEAVRRSDEYRAAFQPAFAPVFV